jgi:hypothetical protein
MKYTAQPPNGPAYELTREEMQNPTFIHKLKIDASWLVRVGSEWIPMVTFLEKPLVAFALPPVIHETARTDALLSSEAPLTPGSLFALALRLAGAYLLLQVVLNIIRLLSQMVAQGRLAPEFMEQIWIQAVLLQIGPAFVGFYLITGARGLVLWVFKGSDSAPTR